MKIYFCGSVTGGREFQQNYRELIEFLKTKGTVLTEHRGNKELSDRGEDLPDRIVFERDMKWLEQADIVVAEVSVPSLGIGYEIATAEKQGKTIIASQQRRQKTVAHYWRKPENKNGFLRKTGRSQKRTGKGFE